MIDKRKQVRNAILYFVPAVASGLFPLITLPLFTRYLSLADYGVFALAQIWATLLSGISQLGLNSAYNRNYFQYHASTEKSSRLLYSVVVFSLLSASIVVLGTYFYEGWVSRVLTGSPEHGRLVTIALSATCLVNVNAFYLNYFRNSENAMAYVVCSVGFTFLNAVVGVILIVFLRVGVIGLVYSQLISAICFLVVITFLLSRRLPLKIDFGLIVEALKIGYPLASKSIFGLLNQQFDKYMIGLLGTIGGVGVYSVAQNISYMAFVFITAIQNVFSPRIYSQMFDNPDKGGEAIGHYLTPFMYLSFLSCVVLAQFAEEVVYLLLPESFHGAMKIIPILTMYYGLMFFGKVIPLQLMFAKKAGVAAWLLAFSIFLNVALNIPFIKMWGVVGAAWATLIASTLSAAVGFWVAQRHFRIGWEYRKLLLMLLGFLTIVVVSLTMEALDVYYLIRLAEKLIAIGLYIYLGLKIGVVTKENALLIKDGLSARPVTSG